MIDIDNLKEKFLIEYCKKMGWDPNMLSTEQYLIIVEKDGYKNPIKK